MINFEVIRDAFEYVSFSPYGQNMAIVDLSTGEAYFRCDLAGIDEIPEDLWGKDGTIEIPHKNDLNLGQQLVFDFTESHMPDKHDKDRNIFSRRGAYARFKDLLEHDKLLETWYDHEREAQEKALRDWCKAKCIDVTG